MKLLPHLSLVFTLLCCAQASLPILSWTIFTYNATLSDKFYTSQLQMARSLPGLSGFDTVAISTTSGEPNKDYIGINPIILAAVSTQTKLIVTISQNWATQNHTLQSDVQSLINAISEANIGYKIADLIVGIIIGSADLQSLGGALNKTAQAEYVTKLEGIKSQLQGTTLRDVPIGHMEIPEVWWSPEMQPILSFVDFIGVAIYPFQRASSVRDINDGIAHFNASMTKMRSIAGGKPLWVQTGWPSNGNASYLLAAANSSTYWHTVGCNQLFNITNTIWEFPNNSIHSGTGNSDGLADTYNLVDSTGRPLFDFTCRLNSTSDSVSDTGLSNLAKVGTGIGASIGVMIVLITTMYLIRRRGQRKKLMIEKSTNWGAVLDECAEPGVAVESE